MRSVRSKALFEQMKGRGVRVMDDADFRAVTPDAHTKTHFVIVDCVGVFADQKSDPPMDRDPTIPLKKLLEAVRAGNRDPEILSTLSARINRIDLQLSEDQRNQVEGVLQTGTLQSVAGRLITNLTTEAEEERVREKFGLSDEQDFTDEQLHEAQQELREEAVAPIAYSPALCETLLTIRRDQEVTIDAVTVDSVRHTRFRTDLDLDYDDAKELVSEFETFVKENPDQIDALSVLYSKPYAQRLTRAQLMELVDAIKRPPRRWTTEAIWRAYEKVEAGKVRGASRGKLLTDVISLARHALGQEEDLVSYRDQAEERFVNWLAQQENGGRKFTEEQLSWLYAISEFAEIAAREEASNSGVYSLTGTDDEAGRP